MRWQPHLGFSRARQTMSCWMSAGRAGRRLWAAGEVQRRRTMRRCQRSSVFGGTRHTDQRAVGAADPTPQAAHGRRAAAWAGDAGGATPQARGAAPRSRPRWPTPTESSAGPARGCDAGPGRRTTRPRRHLRRRERADDGASEPVMTRCLLVTATIDFWHPTSLKTVSDRSPGPLGSQLRPHQRAA
jgi:hypothetical protein